MKQIPDKIKFTFTQTELLNLSTMLHQVIMEEIPEQVDNSVKAMYFLSILSLKKLYLKIRVKIEDGPANGPVKLSLKPMEYLAFYTLFITQETPVNQSYKMLTHKIITSIDKMLC